MRWPPQSVGVQAGLFGIMAGTLMGLGFRFFLELGWTGSVICGSGAGVWAWYKFHQLTEKDQRGDQDLQVFQRHLPLFVAASLVSAGAVWLAAGSDN